MSQRLANRVLLVGWDAADWRLINPLIEAGKMPTLARLKRDGVWGNLAALQPMLSPMLWNSIATGKRPGQHGIHGFTEVSPDGQSVRAVSSHSRRCKAIWNILTQNQLESIVVGWYASHPAEPIRGSVVTNQFDQSIFGKDSPLPNGSVHPDSLAATLETLRVRPAEIPADAVLPFVPSLAGMLDTSHLARLPKLQALIAQSATVHAAATWLLSNRSWDLAAIYYEGIDRFGHEFMPYHSPRLPQVSDEEFEAYSHVMEGCYRYHDMMLDALLGIAGDDTTVVVVSDHGYHSDRSRPTDIEPDDPTDCHRPFGIVCMKGPGVTAQAQLYGGSLLDVTPTLLTLLGIPVGADMEGRPWAEVLDKPGEIDRVPSWDEFPGDAGMHTQTSSNSAEECRAALQQLIDLGYLAPLTDDIEKSIRQTIDGNLLNLAISQFDARRAHLAEPIARDLHTRYPDDAGVRMLLARCCLALGRQEEARKLVAPLLELPVRPVTALLLLAAIDEADNNPAGALDKLNAALAHHPVRPQVLNRIGNCLLLLARRESAEDTFARSLLIESDNPPALEGLAHCRLAAGDATEALDHALAAVSLAHVFPRGHLTVARCLGALGQFGDAITAAELAASQVSGFIDAHAMLADLYERTGRSSLAARHRINAAPR